MIIRRATLDDSDACTVMATAFLTETTAPYAAIFTIDQTLLRRFVDLILEHGHVLVAEDEPGHLVGMCASVIVPVLFSGQRCLEEQAWYVAPNHRDHRRIGIKLLAELEDWAIGQSLNMIKLVAPAGSKAGAHYERLGYQQVETAYVKVLRP